jgi:hypothetical protein
VTTTTTKIIVVVEDDDTVPAELQQNVDSDIKSLLVSLHVIQVLFFVRFFTKLISCPTFTLHVLLFQVKIHQLYIADLLNPFKDIGSAIVSKRFDERVQKYVAGFNDL